MKQAWMAAFSLLVMATFSLPAQAKVPGVPAGVEGATKGIVAVSHPAAAQVGKDILARGGNAVDAASAIQLALNVAEPYMSGIGGGGFMMIYLKDKNKVTVIDSREAAPEGARPDMFLDAEGKPIPFAQRHTNGTAVGIPGTLRGIEQALERYGTMKLADVIEPAIRLADEGVYVNWVTADSIAGSLEKLQKQEAAARVFAPGGVPLKEGDLLVQPDLAKTLRLIRDQGTDAFYRGQIGQALVQEVQKTGGSMTMQDLRQYEVREREPLRGKFRGYEIVTGYQVKWNGELRTLQLNKP